jgi:5'-3' exonuclease
MFESIALVDFSHMLVCNFSALGPELTADNTLAELHALRANTEHVIITLDAKPYYRNKIHEDYKKRPPRDPQLVSIWERCIERVRDEGYQIAKAPGEEADDVMGTLAARYVELGCKDVRLVTQDKDVLQLVSEHVRVFYPITGKRGEFEIRGPDYVMKAHGVKPADFALFLAMTGDTSDHIPGIKGWGPKTAAKYINGYGADLTGKHAEIIAEITNGLVAADRTAKIEEKQLSAEWRNFQAGVATLGKWLILTTARTNVALERTAESYLEKLESRFPEEEQPIEEGEFVDDGAPTAEELEEERQRMAAELPVDPAPEETRSAADRQVAAARAMTPAQHDELAEKRAAEMAAHDPAKMIVGKDPKADEVLRELAAKKPAGGSSGSTSASTTPTAGATTPPPAATTSTAPSHQAQTASASRPAAAPSGAGAASSPPAATQPAPAQQSAPQPSGRVEVVPSSQGPAKPKPKPEIDGEPEILAITPFAPPSWALATQPHSAGHAFAIAKRLWKCGLYSKFKNEDQVAAVMLRGRELGIGMTTALEAFYVVRGRPFASAQLISGLAEQDRNHDYAMLMHLDEKRAVVEIKHKRQPKAVPWEYTIDEADKLGLLKPSPETGGLSQWVLRPKTMLAKTVRVIGERYMFPGATLGLHAIEMEPELQHMVKADE